MSINVNEIGAAGNSALNQTLRASGSDTSPAIVIPERRLLLADDVLASMQATVSSIMTVEEFRKLQEVIPFNEYLKRVSANPNIVRTSAQRALDMVIGGGRTKTLLDGEEIFIYNLFSNPPNPDDAISGNEKAIHDFAVEIGRAAKDDRRLILLYGPVGSSKTTLVRNLFSGLERYSKTDDGQMFSLAWDLSGLENDPAFKSCGKGLVECQIHEDPMHIIPIDKRRETFGKLNEFRKQEAGGALLPYSLYTKGGLCRCCDDIYRKLLIHHNGNTSEVLSRVKAKRFTLDSDRRQGLTFYGAKDEKGCKPADLVGDINWRRLLETGSESDPQTIEQRGQVLQANRGGCHLGEVLKLPKKCLTDYWMELKIEQWNFSEFKFHLMLY